jgi:hypothetical protein
MSKLHLGARLEEHDELIFGANDLPDYTPITIEKHFEYDQSNQKRTRNACVLYASIGVLSDIFEKNFTLEEILEIVDLAEEKYGWVESKGMWLHKGANCVRSWWNTNNPDRPVTNHQITVGSDEYFELIENGYPLMVGYYTNSKYYQDKEEEGIINEEYDDTVQKKYGHAVRQYKKNIIDNYKDKRNYNIYKNEHILELKKLGLWFTFAHALVPNYQFIEKRESAIKIRAIWDRLDSRMKRGVRNFKETDKNGINQAYIYAQFLLGEVEVERDRD